MIIGQDKERVRLLEVQCKRAYALIDSLRGDLEVIRECLIQDLDAEKQVNYPYAKITHDICCCLDYLDYYYK